LGNNKTVLVIDDDAHIRRVVELKLKKNGFRVLTACNGEEGLELTRTEKPAAVVSDIMMPKMDGESYCKASNAFKKEWPFLTIMMTNRISPNDRHWVKEMTDTVFMEKPFSPSKLLTKIQNYLSGGSHA
jgi:DNA-binding response OmpR family regulator